MDQVPPAAAPDQGTREVDARWQNAGDGRHYASSRWRNARARDRDPRMVLRLLDGRPDRREIRTAIDVPCGAGRLRPALEAAGLRWTGADISPLMLAENDGAVSQGSASALPFLDDAADLVVCCRLVHHYAEAAPRRAVLGELARVARRYVALSYWDAASLTAWRRRTKGPLRRRRGPGLRHAVSWSVLARELDAAGLRPVGRVHSMRWISAQAFILAEIVG